MYCDCEGIRKEAVGGLSDQQIKLPEWIVEYCLEIGGAELCIRCCHTFSYHEQKGRCAALGCDCPMWQES